MVQSAQFIYVSILIMYTSIVIAGGATKVFAVIGIVKYLQEHDALKYIKNFVGTSAGALMSLLLAMDYTYERIQSKVSNTLKDESITTLNPEGIFQLLDTYGISDGENLYDLLDKLIYDRFKVKKMTFIQFAKASGKNLVICVSNLTKECHEFFSVDTTPDMQVAEAIRISCAIPLLFQPIKIKDNIYLDGGIYNNFPIDYFPDHQLRDILGINIIAKNYQKSDDFFQYLGFIFSSLLEKFNKKTINNKDRNVITLEFDDEQPWLSFSEIKIYISEEKLKKYIDIGYEAAQTHIEFDSPKI